MLNIQTKAREFKFDGRTYLKAIFDLMKPRVMSLAIFTCVVGLMVAEGKYTVFTRLIYFVLGE